MKTGYSLLLGEYVEAEALEYHDCEHWQIVCPACKEPLFKCRRETPFVTHYLSHYGKDKAYVDECERRVSSISKIDAVACNAKSREQMLKYFLGRFDEMFTPHKPHRFVVFSRSKTAKKLAIISWNTLCKFKYERDAIFKRSADEWVGDFGTMRDGILQVSLAKDFFEFLFTKKSKGCFIRLFLIGLVIVEELFEDSGDSEDLKRIKDISVGKRIKNVNELDQFRCIFSEVWHMVAAEIIAVDYKKVIRERTKE